MYILRNYIHLVRADDDRLAVFDERLVSRARVAPEPVKPWPGDYRSSE